MSPRMQIDVAGGCEPCEDAGGALELELSTEELRGISHPRAIRNATSASARSQSALPVNVLPGNVPLSRRPQMVWAHTAKVMRNLDLRDPRVAAALVVGIVAVLLGMPVYLSTSAAGPIPDALDPAPPMVAATVLGAHAMPVSDRSPVRFANPFDESEVFEFPPGTSRAEARDKVADLLMRRARERQQRHPRVAAARRSRAAAR